MFLWEYFNKGYLESEANSNKKWVKNYRISILKMYSIICCGDAPKSPTILVKRYFSLVHKMSNEYKVMYDIFVIFQIK